MGLICHNNMSISNIPKKHKFNHNFKSETLSISSISNQTIEAISKTLLRQIDKEIFERKYAPVMTVLKLVGAGVFVAAAMVAPGLPMALKQFLNRQRQNEYNAWKRFNIPYLKITLERLDKQKLVEFDEKDGMQVVKITDRGKRRILKFAIDELAVEKPKIWDDRWRLVSYDIPKELHRVRATLREYLNAWGFYPLHESVFLHAWPCEKQVEFLREYLGIGKYVRMFQVSAIEQDKEFRDFFGV